MFILKSTRRIKRLFPYGKRALSTSTQTSTDTASVLQKVEKHLDRGSNKASLEVAKLNNQLQVVSYPCVSATSSVTLFVNGGIRLEKPSTLGVTQFLKHFAFKDNLMKYGAQLVRELEEHGIELTASVTREGLAYHLESPNDSSLKYVAGSTLSSIILGEYREWVFKHVKKSLHREAEANSSDPLVALFEGLHREAFKGQPLGYPLHIPSYAIDAITPKIIADHTVEIYNPSNLLLVGSGLTLKETRRIGEGLFLSQHQSTIHPISEYHTTYSGGQFTLPGKTDTFLSIAYSGIPVKDLNRHVASIVLQAVLGSGSNVSQEGFPGSGVSGRLARNLVNKHNWIKRASAINFSYYDAGLFGVYAQAEPGNAEELGEALHNSLKDIGTSRVTDSEVEKAKAIAKSHFLRSIEDRENLNEFIARHAAIGQNISPTQFIEAIDNVSAKDVYDVAVKILSSAPTISATGDVWGLKKF
eukprot:TRINITY_DN13676_c0_g1_i2.p1 TRINITY_DN13676_c0_g1~~TRINITY_DN13676_c0_g1_i2.p1  ORF type:complete len:472 (-),score=98.41 TRINITY_DN13676_c0_g1_i2:96-1511(-)